MHALRAILPPMTVGQLFPDPETHQESYVALRVQQNVRNGRKGRDGEPAKITEITAREEWGELGAAIRAFAATFELVGVPNMPVTASGMTPVFPLGRAEVARILWAIRGRRWDPVTGEWRLDDPSAERRPSWDPETETWRVVEGAPQRVVERVSGLGFLTRLVLILVYTGSTSVCAHALEWQCTPGRSTSYVELTEVLEQRMALPVALLHRLGPHAAKGAMAGIPVWVCRRLSAHLARWKRADAAIGHVGRLIWSGRLGALRGDGKLTELKQVDPRLIVKLRTWAGLGERFDLRTLSETCAIWCLDAGLRDFAHSSGTELTPAGEIPAGVRPFKRNPAILRSTALLTGRLYAPFLRRFGTYDQEYLKAQAAALDNPAPTVR